MTKDPNQRLLGRLHRTSAYIALVIVAATCGACDKYEPTKAIERVYRPTQCVNLQGIIPGGWLSRHQTIHPTVCQPMRVSELGVYTYGWGWSRPGAQVEMGKLESSATAAAEQSVALRTQLQRAVGSSDTLSRQLLQDAEEHSKTERRALRMLDNIQHRRKPLIFDRP